MAKTTLVKAQHEGRGPNSMGGCHTRWANEGLCGGHRVAEWLNGLGPDDQPYIVRNGIVVTNGEVRKNWLGGHQHIVVQ